MNAIDDVLVQWLRHDFGPRDRDVASKRVLERAQVHGVSSLLHAAIGRNRRASLVPEGVRHTLHERALRAAAVELIRRQELQRLLGLMADAGVNPILMKGTALAYTHYAEPSQRERGDTDVLIRSADRERLFRLLAEQGYRRPDAAGGELASSEASYWKDGSPLVLDVHWRINNSPLLSGALDYEDLQAGMVPVPELGPHARAPGAVDALLLAAIHRASHFVSPYYAGDTTHRGDRLIWLHDLHLLAPSLTAHQWSELARRAAGHRISGLCLDALRRTREAFGTGLPQGPLEQLARAATRREPSMVFLGGDRRRLLLAEVRALENWPLRWRLLREHALPPADYMLRKYASRHRWLLPALYVRRALGWLTR